MRVSNESNHGCSPLPATIWRHQRRSRCADRFSCVSFHISNQSTCMPCFQTVKAIGRYLKALQRCHPGKQFSLPPYSPGGNLALIGIPGTLSRSLHCPISTNRMSDAYLASFGAKSTRSCKCLCVMEEKYDASTRRVVCCSERDICSANNAIDETKKNITKQMKR